MKRANWRLLSLLLCIAILLPALCISNILAADNITTEVLNYPALKDYTEGQSDSPADDQWSYGVYDYGKSPPFTNSDDDFAAPSVTWDVDDLELDSSWSDVAGAVSYEVNVCEGSELVKTFTFNTSDPNPIFDYGGLLAGGQYEVQVLAKDADGKLIKASLVRRFTGAGKLNYINVLDDFSTLDKVNVSSSGRFSSVTLDNGALSLTGNTKYNYGNLITNTAPNAQAEAVVLKVNAPGMRYGFTLKLYDTENGKYVAEANSSRNELPYCVSVSNPNNYVTLGKAESTTRVNISDAAADYSDGYYLVIPLSIYSDDMVSKIKSGEFSGTTMVFDRIRYKTADGYPSATQNFNGTSFTIDDYALISDVDEWLKQLQENYNSSYSFAGNYGLLEADVYNASAKTLTNQIAQTGYTLSKNSSSRQIVFRAVSTSSNRWGAYFAFTPETDGYYDLTSMLKVIDNTTVSEGTVYYRVIKENANGTEIIYPFDSNTDDWYRLKINTENMNPQGDISAPMAELSVGDKLIIQAYADIDNGGSVNISLGYPTTVLISPETNYKGSAVSWPLSYYTPHVTYGNDKNTDALTVKHNQVQNSRWEVRNIDVATDGTVTYSDFERFLAYANMESSTKNGSVIGWYHYPVRTSSQAEVTFKIGANSGVAYEYTSPVSGYATYTAAFKRVYTCYYRILKNGSKIYPENGEWISSGTSGVETISAGVYVEPGDTISLEIYSDKTSGISSHSMTTVPTVTVLSGNLSNLATDSSYSPLWERPYNNETYSGDFAPIAGSLWDFGILKAAKPTSPTVTAANKYDSALKMLCNSENSETGYIFDSEQLKFVAANDADGMALAFNVPSRGYYDFSTNISILSGAGTVYARMLNGSDVVWPVDGDWINLEGIAGDSIDFSAMEISAASGTALTLQLYVKQTSENTEPITIGLGTPIVHKLLNRIFTSTGNTTVYSPDTYAAFETGYQGKYIPLDSRFNYTFGANKLTLTDSATKTYSVDTDNSVSFKGDSTAFKISAGNTVSLKFVSPMTGDGTIDLTYASVNGVTARLLKNKTVVADWNSDLSGSYDISLAEGDTLTLEINSENSSEIEFENYSISLCGTHNNSNSPEDDAYYAAWANPYSDGYHNGKYTEGENSYWKFRLYDADKDLVVKADRFNSDDSDKLYADDLNDVGYHFRENSLDVDIYSDSDKQYGFSLGFVSPRDDVFNFRTGLRITTPETTATLKMRLIQVSAEDSSVNTVWPAEGEWYETVATTNQDITVPYAEFTVKTGDTIYFQVYASQSNNADIEIDLVSPALLKDSVSEIDHNDFSARIYNATNYDPYGFFKYSGAYVPMENRWNFEFLEVKDDGIQTYLPKTYKNTGSYTEILDTSVAGYVSYGVSTSVNAKLSKSPERNVGASMRFVSPVNSEVVISNAISLSELPQDNWNVYYRIIKINLQGEQETVWPDNGTEEWEVLNNSHIASDGVDIKTNLEIGDQLLIQYYADAPDDEVSDYMLNNSKKAWNPVCSSTPTIVIYDYIEESKQNFTSSLGLIADVQVSPYWKIQYSNDSENPKWSNCTTFNKSWGSYWMNNGWLGISTSNRMAIQNLRGGLDSVDTASVAYLFTPRTDGFIIMSNTNAARARLYTSTNDDCNAKIRITVNNEVVYPENGWITLTADSAAVFKDVVFEVKAGDQVRFEMSTTKHLENGEQVRVIWDPTFILSKYVNIYTETNDIYNMLEEHMYTRFKAMSGSTEFDQNLEASKFLSEEIKKRKEIALRDNASDLDDIGTANNSTSVDKKDDYSEWTETVIKPGGKYQKIIRTIQTSWWVYLLIIIAAVLIIVGTVVTLIILKKKGKIGKKNKSDFKEE